MSRVEKEYANIPMTHLSKVYIPIWVRVSSSSVGLQLVILANSVTQAVSFEWHNDVKARQPIVPHSS